VKGNGGILGRIHTREGLVGALSVQRWGPLGGVARWGEFDGHVCRGYAAGGTPEGDGQGVEDGAGAEEGRVAGERHEI
jgi:hypothetical protein